ncbi:MAG TPA: peroxidase family protein [Candidatus Limnocylindria bacterium]|nr:peroxidase family protein [Candidatus Limnocylindria bacterium]
MKRWREPWGEDLITGLLASTLVIGLFLDGWNHINLQNGALGSFFTPWHGLLYAGFTATFLWVMTRNPQLFMPGVKPAPYFHRVLGVPMRYPLAVLGFVIAMVGMFGDTLWHTELGEENGVARVIGPFHLLLFAGAAALVSAPLRSAWYAPGWYPRESSFGRLFPAVLSLTLVTAVAAFMFQWLSAFLDWEPSLALGRMPPSLEADIRVRTTAEFAAVARVLATSSILLAPLFLVLRRWRLPFGSGTFVLTVVSAAMSALTTFDLGWTIAAGALGGVAFDVVIAATRPDAARTSGYRMAAFVVPLAMWSAYFAITWTIYEIVWPLDLLIGTVGLAALSSVLLSYVAISPSMPVSVADVEPSAAVASAAAVAPVGPATSAATAAAAAVHGPVVAATTAAPASVSRRTFLKGVGLGVGAASVAGAGAAAAYAITHPTLNPNNFSRMFPDLMPFFHDTIPAGTSEQLSEAMRDLGRPGGLLDAGDALGRGPVALIADASVNGNDPPTNPDNPTHTAGVTFFGQLMDLDVTFDARSTLGVPTDPYATPNFRLPAFDLDIVYGLGPFVTPQWYEKDDPLHLRIESGGVFEDLPRNADLMPIVPDPRTDQNLIINGLHCAFILFHNRTVDHVRQTTGLVDPPAVFAEARRLVLWHYQWLILNEFLPLFVGPAVVDEVLSRGRRWYRPERGLATIPVEFQGACFRIGHTMIRPSYRANLKGDQGKPFFSLIFDPNLGELTPEPGLDPADLRGGFRAPRRFIGWQTFFDSRTAK